MNVIIQKYGVLGSKLENGINIPNHDNLPTSKMVFVDPAVLQYITSESITGAGGASGAIYKHLDIDTFPPRVVSAITAPTHAKYNKYHENNHVIHAVGPTFVNVEYNKEKEQEKAREERKKAVNLLSCTYANILQEFAKTPDTVKILRLLPVSGGIFAGPFLKKNHLTKEYINTELCEMTFEALYMAYIDISEKKHVVDKLSDPDVKVYMCIYDMNELPYYTKAMTKFLKFKKNA